MRNLSGTKNKMSFITHGNNVELIKDVGKLVVKKRNKKDLILSSDFVKLLCGGQWPKNDIECCFGAASSWKIDKRRRTLVPIESDGEELPLPDLKLIPINY